MKKFVFIFLLIPIIFLNTEILGDPDCFEPISERLTKNNDQNNFYKNNNYILFNNMGEFAPIIIITVHSAFGEEYMISINNKKENPKEYYLIYKEIIQKKTYDEKDTTPLKTASVKILTDEKFVLKIKNLFNKALLKEQQDIDTSGYRDGVRYIFISFDKNQKTIGGTTLSPDRGTKMDMFVEVALTLKSISILNQNIFSIATGGLKAINPKKTYNLRNEAKNKELREYLFKHIDKLVKEF